MVITKYCTVSFAHSRMVETRKSTEKPISFFLNYNFKKKFWTIFVVFLDICQFCHLLSLFARLKLIKSNKGLFLVRLRFPFHSLLAMEMLPKSMKMQIKLNKVEIMQCGFFIICDFGKLLSYQLAPIYVVELLTYLL